MLKHGHQIGIAQIRNEAYIGELEFEYISIRD